MESQQCKGMEIRPRETENGGETGHTGLCEPVKAFLLSALSKMGNHCRLLDREWMSSVMRAYRSLTAIEEWP